MYLAIDTLAAAQQHAVKVMPLSGLDVNPLRDPNSMLSREIEILKLAKHKNLV